MNRFVIGSVFLILIISASLIAQEEPIEKKIDYSNEKTLNDLSTADLVTALANGQIKPADLSKISTGNLIKAFDTNPLLATKLNDNNLAKENWFKHYQITDKGAKISSYDGTSITTSGTKGCKFDINNVNGASILSTGELILEDGEKLSNTELKPIKINGKVVGFEVSNLAGEKGNLDLGKALGKAKESVHSFKIKPGTRVVYDEKSYESKKEFEVSTYSEGNKRITEFSSDGAYIDEYIRGQKKMGFQGKVKSTINAWGYELKKEFSDKGGKYIDYYQKGKQKGKNKISVFSTKGLVITHSKTYCGKKSCFVGLFDTDTNMQTTNVILKENNYLTMIIPTKTYKEISVDSKEKGTLKLIEKINEKERVIILFNEKGKLDKSINNLDKLGPNIKHVFIKNGEEKELRILEQQITTKKGTETKKSYSICPGENCDKNSAIKISDKIKKGQKGISIQVYSANKKVAEDDVIDNCPEGAKCLAYRGRPKGMESGGGIVIVSGHHTTYGHHVSGKEGVIPFKDFNQKVLAAAACNFIKGPDEEIGYAKEFIETVDNPNARIIVGHNKKAPSPAPEGRWAAFAKQAKQAVELDTERSYKQLGDAMVKSGTYTETSGKPRAMAYYIKRGDKWYYVDSKNPEGKFVVNSKYPVPKKPQLTS